jgi:hypothetical protein
MSILGYLGLRGCIILMMVLGGIVGAAWVLEFSSSGTPD